MFGSSTIVVAIEAIKEMDEKYIFFKDNIPNISILSYNKIFLDVNIFILLMVL
jgi:hypothetical protein